MNNGPLIVQSDRTLLLDVHHPESESCRKEIIPFCSLIKSPEHMHTYRLDSISIWNAVSMGLDAEQMIARLDRYARFAIPEPVLFYIRDMGQRYGQVVLENSDDEKYYRLSIKSARAEAEIRANRQIYPLLIRKDDSHYLINSYNRGQIKLLLTKQGYPVDDRIPLNRGEPLAVKTKDSLKIRGYQKSAADALLATGFGVIVLPCGSGKTVVGIHLMEQLATRTLILTTNIAAVHQWMDELYDKTGLTEEMVGEYSGQRKEMKPVTVCTYQVLTWRQDKDGPFPHLDLMRKGNWGLVIYDEVHMLPAQVFKVTAELQSIYRVGLTATLVREDHREDEVFSLVGPKRYDAPWDELQKKGFIAEAFCHEIRIPLPPELEIPYAVANRRKKYRIASENPMKMDVIEELLAKHEGEFILIIGQYLDQLKKIEKRFGFPIITGSTPNKKRDALYDKFRSGEIKTLIVSKVANFAIDLPDASVAIQISGTFGSRNEEAQRLGRILRPKKQSSNFYTLVTRYSVEEEFSLNRQKFLSEQGYHYDIRIREG